jgi:hypothetical protein
VRSFERRVRGLLVGLAALPLGCNLYNPVETVLPLCDSSSVLSVGPGTQPEISWTGDCRVYWVRVDTLPWRSSGYLPVAWQRFSATASVLSPVRVGVDSTSVRPAPVVLGRGQLYQACLVGTHDPATRTRHDVCVEFTP